MSKALLTALEADAASSSTSCAVPQQNAFCEHVVWSTSLAASAPDRDALALRDFETGLQQLGPQLQHNARCLEEWRALQCAAKFPKCSLEMPVQKARAFHRLLGVGYE